MKLATKLLSLICKRDVIDNLDFMLIYNVALRTFNSRRMKAERKERRAPRQAQWFPMLLSPPALDGSFAGDVGFDPLGFSKDKESMYRMREAEIKHSRLAMLAAAGWPLSELWHNGLAKAFDLESLLQSENRAPSILNGGLLNEWIIGTAIGTVALSAALEYLTNQAVSISNLNSVITILENSCTHYLYIALCIGSVSKSELQARQHRIRSFGFTFIPFNVPLRSNRFGSYSRREACKR